MVRRNDITYVDLFAGIGGFAGAFEAIGARCLEAVEKDFAAAGTYKSNWGHSALGNIISNDQSGETLSIGKHDILSAGFPCQPFSKSGEQLGVLDKSRGTLFHNILKIIENLQYADRPTVVILENVRNLAGPKHRGDLELIKQSLRFLGYTVEETNLFVSPHKIQSEFGGRPQNRERIFIVGTKIPADGGHVFDEKYDHTGAVNRYLDSLTNTSNLQARIEPYLLKTDPNNYWKIPRDLPKKLKGRAEGIELKSTEIEILEAWNEWLLEIRALGIAVPGFPLWTDYWKRQVRLPQACPAWKENFIRKNCDFYKSNIEICDRLLVKLSTLQATNSFRKFEWQAGSTDSIWSGLVHFRPSGIRVKAPSYFPALVAITQTPVIAAEKRRLSLREAAYLQGFPQNFLFDDELDTQHFKQLGNAVNIGVVYTVLKALVARDERILTLSEGGRRIVKAISLSPNSPDDFFKSWRPSEG